MRGARQAWHGIRVQQPDWSDHSHSVAFSAEVREERMLLHLIMNAYWGALEFELPPVNGKAAPAWRRWIDTALPAPHDIVDWRAAAPVAGPAYRAEARSIVVLYVALD